MSEYTSMPSIITFLLLWIVFAAFLVWVSYVRDGWRLLADRYRASQPSAGKVWNSQSGMIGGADYRGSLILTANADGLFMEVLPIFSIGRPRLFIPWSEFNNLSIATRFFWRNINAEVGSPPVTTVRLPAVIFELREGYKLLAISK